MAALAGIGQQTLELILELAIATQESTNMPSDQYNDTIKEVAAEILERLPGYPGDNSVMRGRLVGKFKARMQRRREIAREQPTQERAVEEDIPAEQAHDAGKEDEPYDGGDEAPRRKVKRGVRFLLTDSDDDEDDGLK